MKKIILVSAKAQAGKDTFYEITQKIYNKVEKISFAHNLKETALDATLLVGLLSEILNAQLFVKNVPYGEEFAKFLEIYESKKGMHYWDGEKDDLGRRYLQLIGDAMKELYGQNYFAKYAFEQIFKSQNEIFVITDVRFPFEISVITELAKEQKYEVITVRVERTNFDNGLGERSLHNSEISLDDYKFENKIINDGSLNEYKEKVIKFLKEKL